MKSESTRLAPFAIAVALVASALGFLLGRMTDRDSRSEDGSGDAGIGSVSAPRTKSLREGRADLRLPSSDSPASSGRRPTAVPASVLPALRFELFTGSQSLGELRLSQATVSLLGLSSEEVASVDALLGELDGGMRTIESGLVRPMDGSDLKEHELNSLRTIHGLGPEAEILVVPTFASEAAPIREHFEQSLEATVGKEKANFLLERAADTFETRFGRFGEIKRTIFVDFPKEDSVSDAIKFIVQSTERKEGSLTMKTVSASLESVPDALQHLFEIE